MLVCNVNFQILFSFLYEVTRLHSKHFQDTLDTEIKLSCLFLMWTFRSYFQFDLKSHFHTFNFHAFLQYELPDFVFFFLWSHVSHWKHLQDTLDTEFNLLCLFLIWTFRLYFQFDIKSHVSQLKCELSDFVPFLMWSHYTGNTRKIFWIQDLNFHACLWCELPDLKKNYEVTRSTLEMFVKYFRYWI